MKRVKLQNKVRLCYSAMDYINSHLSYAMLYSYNVLSCLLPSFSLTFYRVIVIIRLYSYRVLFKEYRSEAFIRLLAFFVRKKL